MDNQPRRGRPPKSETTHTERRRRKAMDYVGKRLSVNPEFLDHSRFAYRWFNDKDVRILLKTKHDDWDLITNDGGILKEDSSDLGTCVSVPVGTKADGSGLHAYLARKPRKFYEEDKAEKQAELDAQLERIKTGKTRDGDSQSDYIPSSGIRVA